jgi:hypothetical protein
MWKRCWWATWLSGFFGIAGIFHLARVIFNVRIVIGTYEVPLRVTVAVGIASLTISAGLLWLEVQRERAKRQLPLAKG